MTPGYRLGCRALATRRGLCYNVRVETQGGFFMGQPNHKCIYLAGKTARIIWPKARHASRQQLAKMMRAALRLVTRGIARPINAKPACQRVVAKGTTAYGI